MREGFLRTVLAVAAIACMAGCARGGEPSSGTGGVIVANGDELLPSETALDWRIYADHLVRAHVVAIEKGEPSTEDLSAGEGYVPRILKFSIDEVLWSRPAAPSPPPQFTIEIDGWSFHGDTLTPIRFEGEPMIALDHDYVLPIVYVVKGGIVDYSGWSNLGVGAIVPVANDVLGAGDSIVGGMGGRSDFVEGLWGRSAMDAARILRNTQVPDYAKRYMDLPATDRLTQITLAARGAGLPGPGER